MVSKSCGRCPPSGHIGGRAQVLEQFPAAMVALASSLEAKQLKVNWDEAGYMSSAPDLDADFNRQWDLTSGQKLSTSRRLGTDSNSGAARSVQEQDKRLAKTKDVRSRIVKFGGRGQRQHDHARFCYCYCCLGSCCHWPCRSQVGRTEARGFAS